MESKINMAYTIPKLKSSSGETGSPALAQVTPSSLISRVDSTLTPSPIQVLDRKQARIFSPLSKQEDTFKHHCMIHLTYVFNSSYRPAMNRYGKKLRNQARNPTSIPMTALEKNTLKSSYIK